MADGLREGELATRDQEIITECRERLRTCVDAESTNRQEFERDKKFVWGEQWDPQVNDERFQDRRPTLTVNMTDAVCRRVINSCKENRPRIVVHPVGGGATVDVAKLENGMIRDIETESSAADHYDSSLENAVHGGIGWLGIEADYVSDDTFDQKLQIVGWPNPLLCYGDPNSRELDGSDMEFFMETKYYKRTEYRALYGKLDPAGWQWGGGGDDKPDWSNKEEIRVCKYWRVERVEDTLWRLSDGSAILASKAHDIKALGLEITDKRQVVKRRVCCYLLTAHKILAKTEWPGRWIPRVPVYGRRMDLNGRVQLKGLVRDLRDPAKIYNYARTKETETYALQPNAQWLGHEGFMEGHENLWRDTNRKPIVSLEYKITRDPETQQPAPPPQRLDPPAVNAGFAEWSGSTKNDFMALAGQPHDPGIDQKGEVVSGIAIKRREGIADISNFDFYDNLCKALRHLGRILVDLIPHFYDTRRMVRIVQEDGKSEMVLINEQTAERIKNDVTTGEYDVVVDTGPAYSTRRQESREELLELLNTHIGPMLAQVAADKIVRLMDFPDAEAIADRLAAVIPGARQDIMQGLDPKAQAIVASLLQQVQQLQQQLAAHAQGDQAKMGLEQMRQAGETDRARLAASTKVHDTLVRAETARKDTQTRAETAMHDTAVRGATAMHVAETGEAGRLMDTAMSHRHEIRIALANMAHERGLQLTDLAHEAMQASLAQPQAPQTRQ